MDDLTQHRKRRLRALIDSPTYGGSQASLAKAAGLTEGRVSQLLDPNQSFGERSARNIASELRLGDRYFEDGFGALEADDLQEAKDKHESFVRLLNAVRTVNADISGPQKLADAMNESAQTVTNWGARGVSAKAAAKAQALFGVSSSYVLEGVGARFVRAADDDEISVLLPTQDDRDLVRIPLLANCGSMGPGNEVLDADYVVGDLALSSHWINQYIKPGNIQELKFIHAHGESMAPTFSDGDVLLVDAGSRDPASHEGVYVLEVHGKTYIKRVRMRMSGTLEVSSDNPTIKTVDELNGDHEVRVLGRVVWAWNGRKL